MELGEVKKNIGNKVALQGNLDPTMLYAGKGENKRRSKENSLFFWRGQRAYFNLGHGILPDVDPENAKAMVQLLKKKVRFFTAKMLMRKIYKF